MDYKLIVDSCCELVPSLKNTMDAESVPLSITLEGVSYIDDETLSIPHFLKAMKASKHMPKSACPSPEAYAEKFRKAKHTFAVTISSRLSGSHNSAIVGTSFINDMKTFFIVENLDTLIKSGRMSRIVGYVASAMSLRPIMEGNRGEIKLYEKARGSVRAFTRLIDIIGECCTDFADRTLVITHCNNERQANFIKSEAQKRYGFKAVQVVSAGGISSMYANEGGVIIAF